MADGRIDEYVDRNGVKQDTTFILDQLNLIQDQFDKLASFRLQLNTDGSFKDAAATQAALKKAQDDLTSATKLYKTAQDQIIANQAKLNAAGTENAQTIAQQKVALSAANAELKNQAVLATSAQGSIKQLTAQLAILRTQYDNLGTAQRSAAQGTELLNQIKALDIELKSLKADTGRFQDNVGNYAGSLKPAFDNLTTTLATLKGELSGLSTGSPAFQDTTQKIQTLEKVIEGLQGGFSSTRSELRAFQEAAVQLGLSFGQTDDQFLKFNSAIGHVKNSIQDIKAATAFQAKDNNVFVGLVNAANGLVGAFGAAQGAMTLFGDDSEQTQKKMVQLQSILVIINGLQQVANSLETESGAVQLALSAKIGLVNAARKIQSLLIVQSVAAIQTEVAANTELAISQTAVAESATAEAVAVEGATVANTELAGTAVAASTALEAETVVAGEAAVATTTFSTALIATGIGAIILAIGAAIVYVASKIPGWIQGNALTIKQQGELADTLKTTNELIVKQADFIASLDQSTQNYYKNQIALSESAGENEEKRLALRKALAKTEHDAAQQTVNDLGATNSAYSEAASTIQILTDKQQAALDIQKAIQAKPTKDRTSEDKDNLEAAKSNYELFGKLLAGAQVTYDAMGKARKALFDSNLSVDTQQIAADKLTADEQRKLVLETTQIEADAVEAKNGRILNSDRATQQQQLAALKSNRAAQISVINAQKNDVLDNPASSTNDKVIAQKKANEQLLALNVKYQEDLYSTNESWRLRDLAAQESIEKSRLDATISANDAIVKDDNNSLGRRLSAYESYINAEKALADEEFNTKLKAAGFSDEEIAAIQRGDQVQIEGKKITNTELEALEVEHSDRLKTISNNTGKEIYDIVTSWAKKQEDAVLAINKLANDPTAFDVEYQNELSDLNRSFEKKKISIAEYNDARLKLEQNYQAQVAAVAIQADQKAIANLTQHHDEIKQNIESAQSDLNDAAASGDLDRIASDEETLKALLDAEIQNDADILAARKKLNEDITKEQQRQAAIELKLQTDLSNAKKAVEQEAITLVKTIGDAQFTNDINQLQDQIDAVNTLRDVQIAAENATTDSAQEKADKITVINATAAAQANQLAQRQKQDKVKQAEFDKQIAIGQIIEGTAVAVINALGAKPWGPQNIALAEAVGALGLLQLAVAEATPIPTYKMGTKDHPGGLAEVGHGRPELVVLPSGDAFITPSTETIYDLPEHTRVLPDAAHALSDGMLNRMVMNSFGNPISPVKHRTDDVAMEIRSMKKQMISAIVNQPIAIINNTHSGVQMGLKKQNSYMEWVNKNMQNKRIN